MPDVWFLAGIALGMIVTSFSAIGSYDRGLESVRRRSWSREHAARKQVALASRAALRAESRLRSKGLRRAS